VIAGTNTHTGIDFRDTFVASGIRSGLSESDLPWVSSGWNEEGGYEAAAQLMARNPDLTAIMAGNDRMAIGAMRYLHTLGKSIPHDVSVMGMDDVQASRYTTPGLTTIRLDLYQLGQTACQRLLQILNDGRSCCGEYLPAALVQRESTGPAPV
jgi:DNA-binding LacI/PurR family transcriptional regulator